MLSQAPDCGDDVPIANILVGGKLIALCMFAIMSKSQIFFALFSQVFFSRDVSSFKNCSEWFTNFNRAQNTVIRENI